MTSTEAAAPSPSERRGPRFSLRSLLLAMAACGVLLGWYGAGWLEVRRERAALAELRQYGADAQFRDGRVVQLSFSGARFDDEALGLLDRFPKLERLVLIDTSVSDTGLRQLPQAAHLRELLLLDAAVTDRGLEDIARLANLEVLRLDNTRITDAGLARLAKLKRLERLDLAGTRITDRGLDHLAGLKRLEQLYLTGADVTDAGVQALQRRLPDTRIVR